MPLACTVNKGRVMRKADRIALKGNIVDCIDKPRIRGRKPEYLN